MHDALTRLFCLLHNRNTTKIGDHYISVQRVGKKTFENDVSVFIGNLPLDVQENAIREFFSDCSRIQGVRLIRDSKTGIGKGFGFVSFDGRDGVILALEKNGAEFEGREIRVMKAGRETQKKENHSRKRDSKNARRRLRDSKGRDTESPANDGHEDSDGDSDAEEDGGAEAANDSRKHLNNHNSKKGKKKKNKMMFSGAKPGKSVSVKKKAKHKLRKGRQSAGKKQAIARLLTA
jgi:nucleolar protein 12